MNYNAQLDKAFEDALHLPLTPDSKYILMSDCHRGDGTWSDTFLKNQNLFFTALQYYYKEGHTYIELGDGDELWESRSIARIIGTHSNTFWLMSKFYEENRLYLLYGNHDLAKNSPKYSKSGKPYYYAADQQSFIPLFPRIRYHEGLILDVIPGNQSVYLTHGHQADFLNSKLWKMARFMVRYLWRPIEFCGFMNPVSASKNNSRKRRIEQNLNTWIKKEHHILVTGHTHQPRLPHPLQLPYLNTGSCIHPRCITAIEIENHCFSLVKWSYTTRDDFSVAISREILEGPFCVNDYEI